MELMDEPVLLPSGHYIDLKNLKRYLLNNNNDPFTTLPLKLEDCKVDVELKRRIDEYKQKKKEGKNNIFVK